MSILNLPKLNTLLARLTSGRADNLDNLDAALSTLPGRVKSIQTGYSGGGGLSTGTGEDAKYADITVSSVDTSKSVVFGFGHTRGAANEYSVFAKLTSSTNLRLSTPTTTASELYCRWTVVEYY